MKGSRILKTILHIAFPLAERIIPDREFERLVGGLLTLPLRLVPLLIECAAYLGLVLLGQYALETLLYEFVVLLKLPKVFRIEWLQPEFFAMLGGYFRQGGLVLLGIYAAYRLLGTAGSAAFVTAREVVILKRWPFSVSVIRVPLTTVRRVSLHQFPGERLIGTGRMELAWSDGESLVLPVVFRGESKLNSIMTRLHGLTAERGPTREEPRGSDRPAPIRTDKGSEESSDRSGNRGRRRKRRRGRKREGDFARNGKEQHDREPASGEPGDSP